MGGDGRYAFSREEVVRIGLFLRGMQCIPDSLTALVPIPDSLTAWAREAQIARHGYSHASNLQRENRARWGQSNRTISSREKAYIGTQSVPGCIPTPERGNDQYEAYAVLSIFARCSSQLLRIFPGMFRKDDLPAHQSSSLALLPRGSAMPSLMDSRMPGIASR